VGANIEEKGRDNVRKGMGGKGEKMMWEKEMQPL